MSTPGAPRPTPAGENLEERPEEPGEDLAEAKASAEDLAGGETPGERELQTATSSPAAVALGGGGLQIDGHDAQRWLDRRAAWIERETEAGRLETARLDVRDLRLHPDLSEEGH